VPSNRRGGSWLRSMDRAEQSLHRATRFTFLVGLAACAAHAPPTAARAGPLSGVDTMVVATIHGGHFVQPEYPLATLRAILEAYRPDLVLVEIRPEAFAAGLLADGPPEMTYVTVMARARGVAVAPIDWWLNEDVGAPLPLLPAPEQAVFDREDALVSKDRIWPPSFHDAHSERQSAVILASHNLEVRHYPASTWPRRQAWFHAHAVEEIERARARRVLAFVGQDHRPELDDYLRDQGATDRTPLELPLPALAVLRAEPVPAPVLDAWRLGAEALRQLAARSSGRFAEAMAGKARDLDQVVASRGACCREPKR
jgi:hypothetical protein